jgi:hypothetical protein
VPKILRRPEPSILSEAIPLFFIGRNKNGLWVAREVDGRIGGIFLLKRSAVRFANASAKPFGCAMIFLSERFELDVKNSGNSFVAYLGPAKHAALRLALGLSRLVIKIAAAGQAITVRLTRAFADERKHRRAIERDLFKGRYKFTSKNEDDLPIVR